MLQYYSIDYSSDYSKKKKFFNFAVNQKKLNLRSNAHKKLFL